MIWSNSPRTGGSTEVISKRRKCRRPWAESGLPDGPGGKLKRVTIAPKLRTRVDMAFLSIFDIYF